MSCLADSGAFAFSYPYSLGAARHLSTGSRRPRPVGARVASTQKKSPLACFGPLLNRISYTAPERSVTGVKIKPNSHRFTYQILLRHEPGGIHIVLESAVLAVIAVVTHEEIVPWRHHP